jgi:alpha-amylase
VVVVVVVVVVVLVLVLALALLSCADPASVRTPPADFRDEVIYELVIDRFANGDPSNDELEGARIDPSNLARHQGGDLRGIREHLDYLEHLGVTTLWISPVVANVARHGESDGYHGYWASDFTRLNPRFGSEAELRGLVDDAHARGMKVLLDVVINHAGPVFFYDLDADGVLDTGESEPPFAAQPYEPIVFVGAPPHLWRQTPTGVNAFELGPEHFHRRGAISSFSPGEEILLGDFPTGLRDLATTDSALLDALADTYVEWARRSDVDGFRLDAAPHVAHVEWKRFCTRVRGQLAGLGKERFLLLGEVFRGEPDELASYTLPGEFDAVFDFTFKREVIDRFVLEGGSPDAARRALEMARAAYPTTPQEQGIGIAPAEARVAFADNHDLARLRGRLDDERAVSLALTLTFTVDAVPTVYYGTEQGFHGTGGHASREVLWITDFDESRQPFRLIQRLASLRGEHSALRYGDLSVRYAAEQGGLDEAAAPLASDAGLFAYERTYAEERVLVVINATAEHTSRASFDTGFAAGTQLRDAFTGTRLSVGQNGELDVTLPGRSALMLVAN